jgi:hypothetical protein
MAVALPCAGGVLLANFFSSLAKLKKPEQVAISIECCYQNVGIATSVVVNMFDDPAERAAALSVPLFYGFLEAVLVGCYCVAAWKLGWTRAPSDEKLCVVLTRTYQVEECDDPDDDDDDFADSDHDGTVPPHRGRRDSEEPLTLEEQEVFRESCGAAAVPTGWRAWLQSPFIPRYPPHHLPFSPETMDLEAVPTCTPKNEPADRSRFVSEDYTATTSGTDSPPNTPGACELLSAPPAHMDLSPLPEDDPPLLPENPSPPPPPLPADLLLPTISRFVIDGMDGDVPMDEP